MITINKLPQNVVQYFTFEDIFKNKPKNNTVFIFDKNTKTHKEKVIFRNYDCHLNTPEFDPSIEKSFMFVNKGNPVPTELQPYVDFAKSLDRRYNQVVVNYYETSDYIELHSDCTKKLISEDSPILIININESDDIYKIRHMTFIDRQSGITSSVPLQNNTYFILNNNSTHRHGVGMGVEKRVSLTFRMVKE